MNKKFILNFIFANLLFTIWISSVKTVPDILRIGGIFSPDTEKEEELSFKIAIEKVNNDMTLLPLTKIIGDVHSVQKHDSFFAGRKVCSMIKYGAIAIFGPLDEVTAVHVKSICDYFDIPNIEMRWNVQPTETALNLYPHFQTLAKAYIDLLVSLDWEKFIFVYEDDEEIMMVNEFYKARGQYIKTATGSKKINWHMLVYQFKFNNTSDYRDTFWAIKRTGEYKIVLHVRSENLHQVMKEAQQVGLLNEDYHFIVTSLDFHTIDLEDFKYSGAAILSFRLTDPTNPVYVNFLHDWNFYATNFGYSIETPENIKTSTALIYDAVKLFAKGVQEVDKSQLIETVRLSCDEENTWEQGTSIINSMRALSIFGVSGHVSFDQSGKRSLFMLHLNKLTANGLKIIGNWTDVGEKMNERFNVEATPLRKVLFEDENSLKGKTLIVSTVINSPFTMLGITSKEVSGNARYEGYAVDLVQEIADFLGFKFEIVLAPDGKYGSYNEKTGEWNGIIGEVLYGRADFGIVDLTITEIREKFVDFTSPFMTTGISILFRKPKKVTSLFGFLDPFSYEVYGYILITVIGTSLVLYIVGRLTPYEWSNPLPCREEDSVLQNSLNIRNSFWFTVGSLMQQGSDVAPRAMSTRWIAGIWYFFTLILVSSYTANLAAFLTVESPESPINNVKELSEQTEIKYGCYEGGATSGFFSNSVDPVYRKIWEFMSTHPEVFTKGNDEGVHRVSTEEYAFFMESAAIEYRTERNCNLTQIGGALDSKGYGIAVRKNSNLLRSLSRGVLYLQESGRLKSLYDKWWKEKRGGGACLTQPTTIPEITLSNVGGVFVVLLLGFFVSIIMAIIELFYGLMKKKKREREREAEQKLKLKKEMKKELGFAFNFKKSYKPNKKNQENLIHDN